MKKISTLLAIMMVAMTSWAGEHESSVCWVNGFGFSIDNETNQTMKVADCSNTGNVTIPSTVEYNGKTWTVITIAKYCFENKDGITSLTIPSSICYIDCNAFDDCDNLTNVTFMDGNDVLNVGYSKGTFSDDELFYDCDKLNEVYLGRTLAVYNNEKKKPFEGVTSLKTLRVGPQVTSLPGYLAKEAGITTLDLSRATSLRTIGEHAFENIDGFTTVDFSGCTSLTHIYACAFHDCDNCATVDLSACRSLYEINDEAFCNMDALTKVVLDNCSSLDHINPRAFMNNSNLASLSMTGCTALKLIDDNAFEDADALTVLDLTGCTSLTTLDTEAFFACDKLVTVKFPPSLTTIGTDCFDCSGAYNSTVKSVYFYGDSNSVSTQVTNYDVDNFDEATFVYLDRLVFNNESGTIPFGSCENITLGNHLTTLPSGIFSGDTNLKEVSIMSSVKTEICSQAFNGCTALTNVTLMDEAKIDANAFNGCTGLHQIFLSDKIEMAADAFSGCTNINHIYVNYNYEHTTQLVANSAFPSSLFSTAKVTQCGTYDASDDAPWNQFTNKEIISTPKQTIDRTSTSAIASDEANAVNMPLAAEKISTFMVTFPFPVSTYYFGADAKIYSLDSWNKGPAETGAQDIYLDKINLDESYTLPSNRPLLVVTSHADNNVQATIDLFETKQISVLSYDYSKQQTFDSDVYTTTALNHQAARPFDDRNVYVIDNGYLKRVNSADYQIPAFAVSLAAPQTNADLSLRLFDNSSTGQEIVTGSASVTPNQYLEGYVTFYNTTSNFEISEGESGNPSGAVYTIISTPENNMIELHRVSDGIINKGQAVLIKAKAGTKLTLRMVTNGSSDAEAYENNKLKGVAVDTPVADLCTDGNSYVYVLSCDASKQNVGFYKYYTGKTLGAYKAYIQASALNNDSGAKAFVLPVGTAIQSVSADDAPTSIYDISGRKVSNMKKNNIYIIDNKKAIIK